MSRELWAVERCEHGFKAGCEFYCAGGSEEFLDFDAIWTRYRKAQRWPDMWGLTYNELWEVVYGEKKEEE